MSTARSRGVASTAAGVLAGLVLVAGLAACDDDADRPDAGRDPAYPSSMTALGASNTRGYNTDCPDAWTDCPDNSWATGANPAVGSVYQRLLALNPRLKSHNANDAEIGSTMADLEKQARSAVWRKVELVVIAMGTNDACGAGDGTMTEVPVFRTRFTDAMDTLTTGLPEARIHVVSIPDLLRIWQAFHTVPDAVKAWRSTSFCPTILDRPTSTTPADVSRRAAVRARIVAFNAVLAQVCAEYPRCTSDAGAAFRAPVTPAEVSTNDYWHPSIPGQAALAEVVWDTLGY